MDLKPSKVSAIVFDTDSSNKPRKDTEQAKQTSCRPAFIELLEVLIMEQRESNNR